MRLFEEFWWGSALSRLDIRDAQSDVSILGVHGLTRGVPPEEVTTYNLARRLTGRRRARGGLSIALHSRPLEGGNSRSGRAASGADLELAVEVAPGTWVDFALQAKKFNPQSGKYDGWSPTQNANLMAWAARKSRRAAGMLLYNTAEPPFSPPGTDCALFAGCCCSPNRCNGRRWPLWGLPDGRSPLAVSIVPDISDPRLSGLADPTPKDIANFALPLECLFCPSRIRTKAPNSALGEQPDWVEQLVEDQSSAQAVGADPIADVDTDEDEDEDATADLASYSMALGMGDDERDSYDEDERDPESQDPEPG